MDLISHVSGVGPTVNFSPGANTPAPYNVNHLGVTDGLGFSTASKNMAELYNRLLVANLSVVVEAGGTVNFSNWTQLATSVAAIATQETSTASIGTALLTSARPSGNFLAAGGRYKKAQFTALASKLGSIDDGGCTSLTVGSGTFETTNWAFIKRLEGNVLMRGGASRALQVSQDGGVSWVSITSSAPANTAWLDAAYSRADRRVLVVGTQGRTIHTIAPSLDFAGAAWVDGTRGTKDLRAATHISWLNRWVVAEDQPSLGDSPVLHVGSANFMIWNTVSGTTMFPLKTVSGNNVSVVRIRSMASSGATLHMVGEYANGEAYAATVESFFSGLNAVAGQPNPGVQKIIIHSVPGQGDVGSIWASGTRVVMCTTVQVRVSNENGRAGSWRVVEFQAGFRSIAARGSVLVGVGLQTVWASSNGGYTWVRIRDLPSNPALPGGYVRSIAATEKEWVLVGDSGFTMRTQTRGYDPDTYFYTPRVDHLTPDGVSAYYKAG